MAGSRPMTCLLLHYVCIALAMAATYRTTSDVTSSDDVESHRDKWRVLEKKPWENRYVVTLIQEQDRQIFVKIWYV